MWLGVALAPVVPVAVSAGAVTSAGFSASAAHGSTCPPSMLDPRPATACSYRYRASAPCTSNSRSAPPSLAAVTRVTTLI